VEMRLKRPFSTQENFPRGAEFFFVFVISRVELIKAWFHRRFFSAKCELFRLFLLNCDYSNKLFLLDCSQFKRNRRNISSSRVRIVFVTIWPLEALRKISIVFEIFRLARKKSQRLRILWAKCWAVSIN
jgi:hypothetical protein